MISRQHPSFVSYLPSSTIMLTNGMGRIRSIPLGSPIEHPRAKPVREADAPVMEHGERRLRRRALRAAILRCGSG